jgi:hypothetical protein
MVMFVVCSSGDPKNPKLLWLGICANVPRHRDCSPRLTFIVLRRVVEAYLTEIQMHNLRQTIPVARTPSVYGADKYLRKFYLAIFDGFLTRFADY